MDMKFVVNINIYFLNAKKINYNFCAKFIDLKTKMICAGETDEFLSCRFKL